MKQQITMIAAVAENNALGKNNELLWHLPDDFKRFKALTTGHAIIMGRKTFESLPGLLPNRQHIILTRQKDYKQSGCTICHSLENALKLTEEDQQPFIIGGGEIYSLAMPFATRLEITKVHHRFEADAFFPVIDANTWELIEAVFHAKDKKHAYEFDYLTYDRM